MQKKSIAFKSTRLLEIKKQRRKVFLTKIAIGFLILALFFILLSFASKIKAFWIKDININGASVLSTQEISSLAQNEISGRYLHLFSRKNIFIYPKKKLEKDLKENFKRIKDIDISIDSKNILNIKLVEQNQKFLWCLTEIKCYFLNEDGLIFSEAPYFSGNVYFKFFTNIANPDNPIGAQIFKSETMSNISDFIRSLSLLGFSPVSLSVDSPGSLSFVLEGKNTPKILINEKFDLDKMYNNLSSALSTEPLKTKINTNYASLLYIDLRFENKVYYKFSK